MNDATPPALDVLVVGAGQAGLAAGYWLSQSKRTFVILDRAARIGDSWRQRYDSLTLFTPRAFSSLPGMILRGDPEGYAAAREFSDYLEAYAAKFSLPVRTSAEVRRLERRDDGLFLATRRRELASPHAPLLWPQGPSRSPSSRLLPPNLTDASRS
jgi:putative flavoprotein involved in K+ transport